MSSKKPFPRCLTFRKPSSMVRLTDFPNLRGLVNRKTPLPLLRRMRSMNIVLSAMYAPFSLIVP